MGDLVADLEGPSRLRPHPPFWATDLTQSLTVMLAYAKF